MHKRLFPLFCAVRRLDFQAACGAASQTGWNHCGSGTVEVHADGRNICFSEQFRLDSGRFCRDEKRWCFTDSGIVFQRLRNQAYETIFEFDCHHNGFAARTPYCCRPDRYYGRLRVCGSEIELEIDIKGTRKDEHLRYRYQAA